MVCRMGHIGNKTVGLAFMVIFATIHCQQIEFQGGQIIQQWSQPVLMMFPTGFRWVRFPSWVYISREIDDLRPIVPFGSNDMSVNVETPETAEITLGAGIVFQSGDSRVTSETDSSSLSQETEREVLSTADSQKEEDASNSEAGEISVVQEEITGEAALPTIQENLSSTEEEDSSLDSSEFAPTAESELDTTETPIPELEIDVSVEEQEVAGTDSLEAVDIPDIPDVGEGAEIDTLPGGLEVEGIPDLPEASDAHETDLVDIAINDEVDIIEPDVQDMVQSLETVDSEITEPGLERPEFDSLTDIDISGPEQDVSTLVSDPVETDFDVNAFGVVPEMAVQEPAVEAVALDSIADTDTIEPVSETPSPDDPGLQNDLTSTLTETADAPDSGVPVTNVQTSASSAPVVIGVQRNQNLQFSRMSPMWRMLPFGISPWVRFMGMGGDTGFHSPAMQQWFTPGTAVGGGVWQGLMSYNRMMGGVDGLDNNSGTGDGS